MPDIISKNADGNLEIQPEAVTPPKVVITREHAERELEEAVKLRDRVSEELTKAEENVAQKQKVVDDCIQLGVAKPSALNDESALIEDKVIG